MARSLDGATQYLTVGSIPVATTPLTMACWFLSNDLTTTQTLMIVGTAGTNNDRYTLNALGSVAGDPISALTTTTTSVRADSTSGYTTGAWHHACAVFASAIDRRAFIDGGSKGTDTGNRAPGTPNTTRLGALTTDTNFLNGRIAEAATWSAALTDAEVAMLGLGLCPLLVRPESLVSYWPLRGRYDPEIDIVGGSPGNLTLVGTPPYADHPRIIYAAGPRVRRFTTGGQTFTQALGDTLAFTEVLSRQTQRITVESAGLTESLLRQTGRIILESANLSETLTPQTIKLFVESVVLVEDLLLSVNRTLTESGGLAETLSRLTGKTLAETANLTEELVAQLIFLVSLADTLSLSENLDLLIARTIQESTSLEESASRVMAKVTEEVVGLTEEQRREVRKGATEALALSEALTSQVIGNFESSETVVLTEELRRQASKIIAEILGLSETRIVSLTRTVAETLVVSEALSLGRFWLQQELAVLSEALQTAIITGGVFVDLVRLKNPFAVASRLINSSAVASRLINSRVNSSTGALI